MFVWGAAHTVDTVVAFSRPMEYNHHGVAPLDLNYALFSLSHWCRQHITPPLVPRSTRQELSEFQGCRLYSSSVSSSSSTPTVLHVPLATRTNEWSSRGWLVAGAAAPSADPGSPLPDPSSCFIQWIERMGEGSGGVDHNTVLKTTSAKQRRRNIQVEMGHDGT